MPKKVVTSVAECIYDIKKHKIILHFPKYEYNYLIISKIYDYKFDKCIQKCYYQCNNKGGCVSMIKTINSSKTIMCLIYC